MTTSVQENFWNQRRDSLKSNLSGDSRKKKPSSQKQKHSGYYKPSSSDKQASESSPASPVNSEGGRGGRYTVLPGLSKTNEDDTSSRSKSFHQSVRDHSRELDLSLSDPRPPASDSSRSMVPRVVDQREYANYLNRRFRGRPGSRTLVSPITEVTSTYTPSSETNSGDISTIGQPRLRSKIPTSLGTGGPRPRPDDRTAFMNHYFLDNDGFAMQFVYDFIYRFMDDELIPDLLINTVSLMARDEIRGPSPRELHDYWIEYRFFARDFMEAFINRHVEDELVPDLLIEAIKEEASYEARKPEFIPMNSVSQDINQEIMREVLPKMTRQLVKEAVAEKTRSHLHTIGFAEIFTNFLTNDFLTEIMRSVVGETVREMGEEELAGAITFDTFYQLLGEMWLDDGPSLVRKWMSEMLLELVAEDSVMNDVIESEARKVCKEVLEYYGDKLRRRDLKEIMLIARQKPLASFTLDYLVSQGIGQNSVFGADRAIHKTLEGEVLKILFGQLNDINWNAKTTLNAHPLAAFHEKLTSDVALDVLSNELLNHIDGDLCDLDTEEVVDPDIPRFVTNINSIFYNFNQDAG